MAVSNYSTPVDGVTVPRGIACVHKTIPPHRLAESRGCNLPKGKRDYNADCISRISDICHAKSACKSRFSDCTVQIWPEIPYRLVLLSISITSNEIRS